jgi:hypothetical protein
MVGIMLEGVMGVADYQCRQLLADNYFRLDPLNPFNVAIGLDDVKKVPDLVAFASSVDIGEAAEWLRRRWLANDREAESASGVSSADGRPPAIDRQRAASIRQRQPVRNY